MRSHLADFLDQAEQRGTLNLREADILRGLPGTSPEALRQALHRQQRSGRLVRASRGSGHFVIVPRQDALSGAPPMETWLDAYLSRSMGLPYYVGLLSAAEAFGVSPQAVMSTQVMVPAPRRPVTIGRHQLVFHARSHLEFMPTQWHETPGGRFKVSSPELTVVDLVYRHTLVGGMARVYDVVSELSKRCSAKGLSAALDAVQEVPAAQRLGFLLAKADRPILARTLDRWLAGKRVRTVSLSPGIGFEDPATLDARFKVLVPMSFKPANV